MVKIKIEDLKGVTSFTTFDSGELEECRLNEYNLINTKHGQFIPHYMNPGVRRKDTRALSLYKSGRIKSISLNEQTELVTSIGTFPAELVTFFENGSIDSLFPLNGQLSFSWSEEEEGILAQKYKFSFIFGTFTTKISGIRFHENGNVRSLILWPKEIIEIDSPVGRISIRIGFKLYEDGKIESVEPAVPYFVDTPIGIIKAFDSMALGVDADRNSMKFDKEGDLISLNTLGDVVIAHNTAKTKKIISPNLRLGLMEDDLIKIPISLFFQKDDVKISNGLEEIVYKIKDYSFEFVYNDSVENIPCYGECSECSGCN